MIAVDTSALAAILFREPGAEDFAALIQANGRALVGTPTAFEFRMVARGRATDPDIRKLYEEQAIEMLSASPIELVPFTAAHMEWAVKAFVQYGKRNHPAGLNFGDCMAYAVAREAGCRLLFKGNDFSRTDIPPVAL